MITFLVAAVFGLGLFFFALQHYKFVLSNTTTIESFERYRIRSGSGATSLQKENPYDLGPRANFQQVFGESLLLAFLPVATQLGNGITYPTKALPPQDQERNHLLSD